MRFGLTIGSATYAGLFFAVAIGSGLGSALADNQTPTVSPVSTDTGVLPYSVTLREVESPKVLPNLQSFASGQVDGRWVLIGGRTNGLHSFSNNPLKNFPPRKQNDKIWVIDPVTGERWSRALSDSSLTEDQIDQLSSTATQSMQVGDTLYVIGGYGFSTSADDFVTYKTITAFDLAKVSAWVRRDPVLGFDTADLADLIRQTSNKVLKVTGGHVRMLGERTILAFGQLFDGGYGGEFRQVYTTQIRSFKLKDNGKRLRLRDIRRDPTTPNPTDYRRRDYTLIPYLEIEAGKQVEHASALAGVFTLTDGMFTVPVEIDEAGTPTMADPEASSTFKQAMNGYDTAFLPIWDKARRKSHAVLFGGISYVYYRSKNDKFIEDSSFPFINDVTALVRNRNGVYKQVLVGSFPRVMSADKKRLRFGAEAAVFLDPATPTTSNGMVDLRALKKEHGSNPVVVGRIFGGIAADTGSGGETVASNLIFEIVLTPN